MELFWKELAAAGIRKGVAIGRQIPDDTASVSNDDVHALAVEYPDKIIPFGSLDVSRGIAAAMDELERCITLGFKGIAMEPANCMLQGMPIPTRSTPSMPAAKRLAFPLCSP